MTGAAGVYFGQTGTLPVHDGALQVEPADALGALVGHELRTVARRCHALTLPRTADTGNPGELGVCPANSGVLPLGTHGHGENGTN